MTDMENRALQELQRAAEASDALLRPVGATSVYVGSQSSSTLCGMTGGVCGTLAGVAAVHYLNVPSIAAAVLTALGILGGILWFRGWRGIRAASDIERARLVAQAQLEEDRLRGQAHVEQNRLVAREIMDRIGVIESLNGPPEATQEAWHALRETTKGLVPTRQPALNGRTNETRALPDTRDPEN